MAKYHYNVYPVYAGCFKNVLDEVREFYKEHNGSDLLCLADARNRKELGFLLKALPENVTYMVRRFNHEFSTWVFPNSFSNQAIEHLIYGGHIDLNRVSRDVGHYDLPKVLDDLPYNYHYIIQRYYE